MDDKKDRGLKGRNHKLLRRQLSVIFRDNFMKVSNNIKESKNLSAKSGGSFDPLRNKGFYKWGNGRLYGRIAAGVLIFLTLFISGCNENSFISKKDKQEQAVEKIKDGKDTEEIKSKIIQEDGGTGFQEIGSKDIEEKEAQKRTPSSSLFTPYPEDYEPESSADESVFKGDEFYKKGKFQEAMKLYEQAATETPLDYAFVRIGDIYLRWGKYEKADEAFLKAVKINPNNAAAWFGHADMLLEEGKIKESLEALNKVLQIDPDFYMAYTSMGDVYVELEQWDKAEEMFNKSLEIDPRQKPPDTFIGLGDLYLRTQRFQKAYENYKISIEKDPFDIDGYLGAANSLLGLQQYDQAEKYFLKAIGLHPKHLEAKLSFARFYMGMERLEEAQALLEEIKKDFGDEDEDVKMTWDRLKKLKAKNK